MTGDFRLVPTEPVLVVADVVDRHAGEMMDQVGCDRSRATCLAGEYDAVGGDQGLAGHARVGIGAEIGVEHGITEPVGDLVGVPFGDGLGSEQEFAFIAHGWFLSRRGGWGYVRRADWRPVWRKAPGGSSVGRRSAAPSLKPSPARPSWSKDPASDRRPRTRRARRLPQRRGGRRRDASARYARWRRRR